MRMLTCAIEWSIWNIKKGLVFNNVQPDWSALVGLIKVRIAFGTVNNFVYNLQSIKHNT